MPTSQRMSMSDMGCEAEAALLDTSVMSSEGPLTSPAPSLLPQCQKFCNVKVRNCATLDLSRRFFGSPCHGVGAAAKMCFLYPLPVVDMYAVNEIISILERINITKELLETTRLGKHVNELRRKTSDPTLARRAKVLVKRWRDLVIPTVASPAHTGSNRSSAERQVRRLGGTPLTSPALSRQVVSPAVPSPRPPSRPAWGGYESDSQDVILVDDDPPTAPPPPPTAPPPRPPSAAPFANAHKPVTPPVKRPPSSEPLHDEKKAKRDKKLKKRRGHGRAGSGTETTPGPPPLAPPPPPPVPAAPAPTPASVPLPLPLPTVEVTAPPSGTAWGARNGAAHHERRRNGCRRDAVDPYTALVNRMPPAGAKKVKTTKELLEQIQSRGSRPPASPSPPHSPASPDVMLIEPDSCPIKVQSPLRNGSAPTPPAAAAPPPAPPLAPPLPPLEDEREHHQCTCGEELADETCLAARRLQVRPLHVRALHNVYLPGVNGTRAPPHPHQFAVRKLADPDRPDLFTSVVPLYKYSDYADDHCAKNMSRVPLCTHLPWTEFAPPPPELPPPPSPPPLRPYPIEEEEIKVKVEDDDVTDASDDSRDVEPKEKPDCPKVEPEMIGVPSLEPSERLKAPILSNEEETQFGKNENGVEMEVEEEFKTEQQDHRTVERTKEEPLNGQMLFDLCQHTIDTIKYDYSQMASAPVITLPLEENEAQTVLEDALAHVEADRNVDELGRPERPANFTEWHECARLGELIALPYVVID